LRRLVPHLVPEIAAERVHLHSGEELLDRLRAHSGLELVGVLLLQLAVAVLGEDLLLLQSRDVAGVHDDVRLEVQHAL
jgi:hypothetical protein